MSGGARMADTCACASAGHHALVADRVVWCKACGCVRNVYEAKWFVPIAQVAKIVEIEAGKADVGEPKTSPGTPKAKSGEWPKAGT